MRKPRASSRLRLVSFRLVTLSPVNCRSRASWREAKELMSFKRRHKGVSSRALLRRACSVPSSYSTVPPSCEARAAVGMTDSISRNSDVRSEERWSNRLSSCRATSDVVYRDPFVVSSSIVRSMRSNYRDAGQCYCLSIVAHPPHAISS